MSSSPGGDGLALTYSEVRMDEPYPHGRAVRFSLNHHRVRG